MKILLLDPIFLDYNADTVYRQPLGGMQSATSYLAAALVRRGHTVSLYSQTTQPGEYHGVSCESLETVTKAGGGSSKDFDACVVISGAMPPNLVREIIGTRPALIFWTGHDSDQPAVEGLSREEIREGFDGIALKSKWQRDRFVRRFSLDPAKTNVCRNAVSPPFENLFPPQDTIRARKTMPPTLAYTSTPFRGLGMLLAIFPEVRAAVPGIRLKVFSSMQVYLISEKDDERAYGSLYASCRRTEGVEYRGSIPQHELARELREVSVLAYPNSFPETSCIAVMEAMAAGCAICTSNAGALPETTAGFARLIAPGGTPTEFRLRYTAQLIAFLKQYLNDPPAEVETNLRKQVNFVESHYTWARRAEEWEAWLGELVEKKRLGKL